MTIKLLLALRIVGFALAALTIVAPWMAPAWLSSRLPLVRRVALALGLGAQLGLTATDVARGRAPWTKLVFPIVGSLAALESAFAHAFPWWALGIGGACELALVTYVVGRAFAISRDRPDDLPETRLATELGHFVDERVARFFALDVTLVGAGLRFVFGGFRRSAPAGYAYATHSDVPLLLAVPIFVVLPEAIVFDLLIPHGAWGWRILSDVLHVYFALYCCGAYATFRDRPHRIDDARVRFSRGAFATLNLERAAILRATVLPTTFDRHAWRRAHAEDCASLAVSGAATVEIELARAHPLPGIFGTRPVRWLTISADRPHELARALTAT